MDDVGRKVAPGQGRPVDWLHLDVIAELEGGREGGEEQA